MDQRDDDSLTDALFETGRAGFNNSTEPAEERDPAWLKWIKFFSIVVVLAVVVGLGFLFVDYFTKYSGQTYGERARAERRVERDTWLGMRLRFILGAGIGGGVGLIYVVRCLVKLTDP